MVAQALGTGRPAYSYRNPFHPYQCEPALAFGHRLLQIDPSSSGRGRLIVAEGYLCRGLEGDPWALDTSIRLLQQIVAEAPDDWFARVELADAIRNRFPLSEAALTALKQLRAALDGAPVSERERAALAEYFDENAAALEDNRNRLLPLVREMGSDTTPTPAQSAEHASILMQCGEESVNAAIQLIQAALARAPSDGMLLFYRAEAKIGRVPLSRARALFRIAERQLCEATPNSGECWLARQRLEQLARSPHDPAGSENVVGTKHESHAERRATP